MTSRNTNLFNCSIRVSLVPKGQLTVFMETSDDASIPSALHNSTNCYRHILPLLHSSSLRVHKIQTAEMFSVLFGFYSLYPDHEKGTTSKKALRGPFFSCHLNQSLAYNLACQITCLLQNLQLITLYPNGTKLAHLNSQEMQGSILSNFNKIHVRDGLEVNYREYP